MSDETITVNVKRPTGKAWGVEDTSNPRNIIWLPKSLVKEIVFKNTGAETGIAEITAPEWLLQDRGLI